MLTIFHKNFALKLSPVGKVLWQTDIKNYPGSLKFSIILNDNIQISNGDKVCFTYNKDKIFCGYIFSMTFLQDNIVNIVAYDQIRYLKNQNTEIYENMKASEIFSKICKSYGLYTGEIDITSYTIPFLSSYNSTLLGVLQKALEIEEANTGDSFIIYDDFGMLTLKNTKSNLVPAIISRDNSKEFTYLREIDSDTYNCIKIKYGNSKKGFSENVFKEDRNNVKKWGILQLCKNADNFENAENKAKILLKNKNREKESFSIEVLGGNSKIRAGAKVTILHNEKQNIMTIKKAIHSFSNGEHNMILEALI